MSAEEEDSLHVVGRRTPAHPAVIQDLGRGVIVFLTACAKDRRPLFARPEAVAGLRKAWRTANSWSVGCWVMMPDHLHLFCSPTEFPARPLGQWVRYWKTLVSRAWPWPQEQPIWQAGFWGTQLRSASHYSDRWEYVRQNPVRAGLVPRPEDW